MDDNERDSCEIEELRRQISFLKALPNASPIGMLVVDHRKDKISYFNEAFLNIWGDERLKDRLALGEADYNAVIAHIADQLDDPGAFTACCRQIRASEDLRFSNQMLKLANSRHICFHSDLILDQNGHYHGRMYAFEEVTRIVRAEEDARKSDEQYKELADLLPQIVFEMDLRGTLTFVNRSAYDIMGYTHMDFTAGLNVLNMVAAEDRGRARQNIMSVLDGDKSGYEYTFVRKDGSRFPVRIHSAAIFRDGKPAGLRGFIVDVTEQKAAEAKLQRLSAAIEQSPSSVMIFDTEGTVVYVNPQFSRITGYTPEDTVGKSLFGLSFSNARPEQLDEIASAIKAGHEWLGEVEYKTRNGRPNWVSAHIFPIRDAGGKITHFIDVEEDVTERKISDHEIRKLLMALDQSPNSITITDSTGTITYVNSAFTRLTGVPREEVVGKRKMDLSREHAPHGRISSILATVMSGQNWKSERRVVKGEGSEIWVSVQISPIRGADEKVEYLVIIEEDITERKQAEEKLLLTQTSIDHFHDPCTWADEDGHILYANDATCQALGYSREELLRMKIQDIDPLFPDEQYHEIFQRLKTQGSTHFESVHKASDGRIFPVEISTKIVRFGDRDYAVPIDRDITERKKAEAELRKLSIAVEQSPASVKIVGVNGRIAYVNPKFTEMSGYRPEEVIGRFTREAPVGIDDPNTLPEMLNAIRTGRDWHGELQYQKKNGQQFWVRSHISPIRDETGKISSFIEISEDITEQKLAAEALRENESKFREIFDKANDAIFLMEAGESLSQFRIIEANEVACQWMGYKKEYIFGKNPLDFVIFEPGTNVAEEMEKLYRDGHVTLEILIKTRNGPQIPAEVNIHTYISRERQIIQAIARDITERKLAERQLADNLQFLQIMIDTIPVPIFYKNTQGIYIGCNNAFEKYLGKSREQIIGKTVYDINPVQLADMFHQSDMCLLSSRSLQTYETNVLHADGTIHDTIFYKAPFYNPDGTLGGLIGTMMDITDRKHIEERLRGSLQEKEVLLKEVHHRVKNNLQIISSLLNLQLSGIDQEPVRQILEESQNRVRSIALVHERIYKSDDLSRIDFSEYLKSMCNQLLLTYMATPERVKIKVEGAGIHLGVDQAVPCGLILNELISNSLKHAFPGTRPGTVKISLAKGDGYTIVVEDDGVGLPEDFSLANVQSMGMQLVSALVEQLEGTITFDRTPGTRFTITFPAK